MIPAPHAPGSIQESATVAAWTEQATEALQSVNLSAEATQRPIRGTSVTLSIPLDERHDSVNSAATVRDATLNNHGRRQTHTTYPRSEPMRRDSLKRREALLKGKEGSRQRRRWENGMLRGESMI
jgi:R3H-associated N-terminal domain